MPLCVKDLKNVTIVPQANTFTDIQNFIKTHLLFFEQNPGLKMDPDPDRD